MRPEAFFLPSEADPGGQRFCLFHPAQGTGPGEPESAGPAPRALVLYIHPLAEEMNKSRRMAALQARALARAGCAVLQIDLLGCGDSSGDFGDATWRDWVNDVLQACQWLRRHGQRHQTLAPAPLWLWGLGAGCLLAAQAAHELEQDCHFLFWQPALDGQALLQQWLRLKVASVLSDGDLKGMMQNLRRQWASGSPIEIAGYLFGPELASGLGQAVLRPPAQRAPQALERRLEWFEVSTRADAHLSPACVTTVTQWQQAGFATNRHLVNGPAFWKTPEIKEAPALISATTAALCAATPRSLVEVAA